MSVGSKVIFLVFAVGLQSLFNGDSIGCAYAKPATNLTVKFGTSSDDYYKSLFSKARILLETDSHGPITIGDQNTVQESQSAGFINTGSRIDILDNNHQDYSTQYSDLGAFSLGTHNTVQTSNSNMTNNTGSLVSVSHVVLAVCSFVYHLNIYNESL